MLGRLSVLEDYRREVLILVAAVLGGLIGGAIWSYTWYSSGQGTTVAVLGSGKGVSVLVTHDQRRVLIVSGQDGAEFSNAVTDSMPMIAKPIDVMIIDPDSSFEVQERALKLKHDTLYRLPDPAGSPTPDTILESFQIHFGSDIELLVGIDTSSAWTIDLRSPAGTLAIASIKDGSQVPRADLLVTLNADGKLPDFNPAVFLIGPGGRDEPPANYVAIRPGNILKIKVSAEGFRLPGDVLG